MVAENLPDEGNGENPAYRTVGCRFSSWSLFSFVNLAPLRDQQPILGCIFFLIVFAAGPRGFFVLLRAVKLQIPLLEQQQ